MNTQNHSNLKLFNILAFDTSGDEASVALWTRDKLHVRTLPMGAGIHSQAALLIPAIQDCLKQEGIDFQDLHVIATCRGPGSFTGIRIGLATAQGLKASTKALMFAPSSFEVCAFGTWKSQQNAYLVTLSTKRDSFYTQPFDAHMVPQGLASIQTESEIREFLNAHPHLKRLEKTDGLGAENMIHLYLDRSTMNSKKFHESSNNLQPYYLHDPEFIRQKPWSL